MMNILLSLNTFREFRTQKVEKNTGVFQRFNPEGIALLSPGLPSLQGHPGLRDRGNLSTLKGLHQILAAMMQPRWG